MSLLLPITSPPNLEMVHREPEHLYAAALRKREGHRPLIDALEDYTNQGWIIHVFPWVLGI
jgi:hypothetical protein